MIAWWWDPWSFWWAVLMDIVGRERIAQLEGAIDAMQRGLDGILDWCRSRRLRVSGVSPVTRSSARKVWPR
jgi:alkylation response protein AidB-like acyl-CoA dehydrogenase